MEDQIGLHSWGSANEVVWNSVASGYSIESPPGAHNWVFGSKVNQLVPPEQLVGRSEGLVIESPSQLMVPASLYAEQLAERLKQPVGVVTGCQ